jgi:transcriptional regulator with XRE-family HTH domain
MYFPRMNPILALRTACSLTQQQLAEAAGTSQPTVAAYESGRKSPTWRTVERLADAAGYHADLRIVPALTREDRRSLALHAAIAEHLRAEPEHVLSKARASLARMRSQNPGARQLLDEWKVLLRRPVSALLPILVDAEPWARELRQVTPFTGILSAKERKEVLHDFAREEQMRGVVGVGPMPHAS